jgi:hypothetical protein
MKPCNRCGKAITWGRHEHERDDRGQRRWIPLDAEPDPLGVYELRDDKTAVFIGPSQDPNVQRYTPHAATCPAANQHIRKRELAK